MARDPLVVLSRLRGITLDGARRALADRLGEQDAAAARSADLAATQAHEIDVQARLPALAAAPGAYTAWLKRIQSERQAAAEILGSATEATMAARATVNDERAAARALEAVLTQAQERRRREADRQEQRVLDEAAGLRARKPRWSG
ncbi:MAG TPA: hypothetical protein VMU81_03230 [Acetobacteraceae bacterium]|jgi:flagellar export protein FliJ|nr:hypothetical protein [Acetobacteraceae bacterium]